MVILHPVSQFWMQKSSPERIRINKKKGRTFYKVKMAKLKNLENKTIFIQAIV